MIMSISITSEAQGMELMEMVYLTRFLTLSPSVASAVADTAVK